MKYISTRGEMDEATFSDVTIMGLATDGGLTIPKEFPVFQAEDLNLLRYLSEIRYSCLAREVIGSFVDDISHADLEELVERTYRPEVFGNQKDIVPVVQIAPETYLGDLSNGPTLAFKDVALQLLGNLFEHILILKGDYLNIVGSSSGDTASSAECAVKGKENVSILMLTPFGKMSSFQESQIYGLTGGNVHNLAVDGVFDDCQDLSKAVSKGKFKDEFHIGAVNSYN